MLIFLIWKEISIEFTSLDYWGVKWESIWDWRFWTWHVVKFHLIFIIMIGGTCWVAIIHIPGFPTIFKSLKGKDNSSDILLVSSTQYNTRHRLDSVDACKIYQQINQWMKGSFLLKILQVITSLTKWTCNPQRRKITLEREENTFITPVWTVKSLSGILILPTLTWWVILKRAVTMS